MSNSNLAHTCDALVFVCMDWRLQNAGVYEQIKKVAGIETFDLITVPGGAMVFCNNDEREFIPSRVFVNSVIGLSEDLHGIKKVVITVHSKCGAYGEKGVEEKLIADLQAIRSDFSDRYPQLELISLLLDIKEGENDWEVEVKSLDYLLESAA